MQHVKGISLSQSADLERVAHFRLGVVSHIHFVIMLWTASLSAEFSFVHKLRVAVSLEPRPLQSEPVLHPSWMRLLYAFRCAHAGRVLYVCLSLYVQNVVCLCLLTWLNRVADNSKANPWEADMLKSVYHPLTSAGAAELSHYGQSYPAQHRHINDSRDVSSLSLTYLSSVH